MLIRKFKDTLKKFLIGIVYYILYRFLWLQEFKMYGLWKWNVEPDEKRFTRISLKYQWSKIGDYIKGEA